MSFLSDLITLFQTPVLPPVQAGDPGIGGGASGGDSTGLFPGGGANGGGAPQNAPGGISGAQGPSLTSAAPGQYPSLGGIWQQITAGAPIAGVYALLALLFLIGVVGLVLASGAGEAAVRAGSAEVTGGASEIGRAAGRRVTRRKPPPKS